MHNTRLVAPHSLPLYTKSQAARRHCRGWYRLLRSENVGQRSSFLGLVASVKSKGKQRKDMTRVYNHFDCISLARLQKEE